MDDKLTIGAMCEAFDVTPRTLRFYEQKELLFPQREGQKRYYTRRDQARLKLILRGKRFGFSLEEIRQLLEMYNDDPRGDAQLHQVYSRAKQQLDDMIAQRDELTEAIDDLKARISWGEAELRKRGVDPSGTPEAGE